MRHRNRMARNKGKRMVKTAGKRKHREAKGEGLWCRVCNPRPWRVTKGQAEDRADLEAWPKGEARYQADLEAWATESEDDLLAAWDNLPMPDVEAEDDEKFRFGNGAKDRGMKAVSVRSSGRKEEL